MIGALTIVVCGTGGFGSDISQACYYGKQWLLLAVLQFGG